MTHVNVREVLESLTLAKEAYDAVPDLRRQIDDLQAAVASKDRLLSQTNANLQETIQSKANVEAKLKQTEEERDAYGFRAIDAEEKLEKVLGVVKPATPFVLPQQVSQSAPVPTQSGGATGGENGSTEPVTTAQDHASGTTEARDPVGPTSTTTGTTEPIADTEPVLNRPENWGKSAEAQAQSVILPKSYQSDSGDEDTVVVSKPYLGHPSWEKPHDMSWDEWETKGGTVPGWMKHNG